jgi:hypothetical protein
MTIDILPDDIFSCIVHYIDRKDFYRMTSTNHYYFDFRKYRIKVFEMNKKRQNIFYDPFRWKQKQPLILIILHHHHESRCLGNNPDLHFTRQKNMTMLLTFLQQPHILIEKIVHQGLDCQFCLRNFVDIEKRIHNTVYLQKEKNGLSRVMIGDAVPNNTYTLNTLMFNT